MLLSRPPPQATLFPYTTLFRSEGSRKRVLRGKPVVDGQDTHACLAGDETTGLIVGVEIAEDPAATVQVDEQWPGGGGVERNVEPGDQVAVRAGQRLLGDSRVRQWRAGRGGRLAAYLVTGLGDGQCLVRRPPREPQEAQQELCLG